MWHRIVLGSLIAPGVVPLALALPALRDSSPLKWVAYYFVELAVYAYPVAFLFGVPAFLAFHALQLTRWWHYAIGGVVLGAIPAIWLIVAKPPIPWLGILASIGSYGILIGAVSAVTFWFIAVRPVGQSKV